LGEIASEGVIIVIDLAEERVILAEPEDFGHFSVSVEDEGGDAAEREATLARVVGETDLGRLSADGSHVAVDPLALRSLAGPSAGPAWEDGFARMCAFAAGKGWVEADGAILAHIEWRES
jgi:hypothetical protein